MRWRGKFRDSLESKCGPGKKNTPKVSGNGPCSLNIRSYPTAQPPTICVVGGGFAGLRNIALFGVRWKGCFSPRGCREVVVDFSSCLDVMFGEKSSNITL